MSDMHATHETIRSRILAQWSTLPEAIDRYRVRGELGRGGMGIVYDAYDPRLGRPVAVKVVLPGEAGGAVAARASHLEREIRAAGRIFDPHVVPVLDAGVWREGDTDLPYYVMERVEGPSLEELLEERGALRRQEGLRIAAGIARGLVAVHRSGLVHCDLKPSNVLIGEGGVPKVTDFGLCSLRQEAAEGTVALGSAHYLAPEQVRGTEIGPPADLFALGSILVRMFSGLEAYPAHTLAEHMARVLHDEPEGMGLLDPDLRALVAELMAKRPEQRPDAATTAERLEELAAGDAGGEEAVERPRARAADVPPPHRVRLLQWLVGTAFGLALLAGAGALFALRNELLLLDTEIDTQWKQIETQLMRRDELIPELAELLSRYLDYEREELELILASANAPGEPPNELRRLDARLTQLLALATRSPGGETGRQFRALVHEIAGTQNRIALERRRYNESVGRLNQRLRQLPWSLVSGSLETRPYLSRQLRRSDGA